MFGKILIIDNEYTTSNSVANILKANNFNIHVCDSGKEGLIYLKERACELVIVTVDLTEIQFITKAKELFPKLKIIALSAKESIESAVECLRRGADHFLVKPLSYDALIRAFNQINTLEKKKPISAPSAGKEIIAQSVTMKQILEEVEQIAKSSANVFITGESGTGKEVIAHAIHYQSLRENNPFIRVNCAAIPETLIESEFFGHEKGSFTGALTSRAGRFELAHAGTLLLDEVTEIPLALQAKLLRVVQEREFERVGGTKPIQVDVRLISTSNRNLSEAIQDKELREDLFYRLNVIPIYLPPLRERKDDILPLAEHFTKKHCLENGKAEHQLTKKAQEKLLNYSWPGNIRELSNVIERSVVKSLEEKIDAEDLLLDLRNTQTTTLAQKEKEYILEMLQIHQNDQAKAAKSLGITLRKLKGKIDEHRLDTGTN